MHRHPAVTPESGRTFKEWASIPERDEDTWHRLLAEARAYARGKPTG